MCTIVWVRSREASSSSRILSAVASRLAIIWARVSHAEHERMINTSPYHESVLSRFRLTDISHGEELITLFQQRVNLLAQFFVLSFLILSKFRNFSISHRLRITGSQFHLIEFTALASLCNHASNIRLILC